MSPEAITPAADPITTPMAALVPPMGVAEGHEIFSVMDRWKMVDAVRKLHDDAQIAMTRAEGIFS